MRRDGIPYVPNPPVHQFPVKELQDMSLAEIKKVHIKTCGKADGNVSVCSKCKTPCKAGERAVQLLANEIYNDPPIPLYGGKTLIERAREENMKRRENMNNKEMSPLAKAISEAGVNPDGTVNLKEKKKRNYIFWEGWWEESLASGDQVKWLMDKMNLTKAQAKKKIYQYRWYKGLNKEKNEEPKEEMIPVKTDKGEVEINYDQHLKEELKEEVHVSPLESKLEALMKQQEEYKKEMEKYKTLYEEAQAKYDAVKQKTDILCNAMDILND